MPGQRSIRFPTMCLDTIFGVSQQKVQVDTERHRRCRWHEGRLVEMSHTEGLDERYKQGRFLVKDTLKAASVVTQLTDLRKNSNSPQRGVVQSDSHL